MFSRSSLQVDTDEYTLLCYRNRAAPLIVDHLVRRKTPLRMEVLLGSIDVTDERLRNTDAVFAIEVLEHLDPNVLSKVPETIFGFMQPKIAIFTTPNSDYNVLFTMLPNGFRHHDHRFEWSRQEFKLWALEMCERYPNYRVTLLGVGETPADGIDLGPVSQIALFVRKDISNMPLEKPLTKPPVETDPAKVYREIYAVDFPVHHDERTLDQQVSDELSSFISTMRGHKFFYNEEEEVHRVPLDVVLDNLNKFTNSQEDVKSIVLALGYVIENEYLVFPYYDPKYLERRWSDDSDYDQYEDRNEYEDDVSSTEAPITDNVQPEANTCDEEEEEWWD